MVGLQINGQTDRQADEQRINKQKHRQIVNRHTIPTTGWVDRQKDEEREIKRNGCMDRSGGGGSKSGTLHKTRVSLFSCEWLDNYLCGQANNV